MIMQRANKCRNVGLDLSVKIRERGRERRRRRGSVIPPPITDTTLALFISREPQTLRENRKLHQIRLIPIYV